MSKKKEKLKPVLDEKITKLLNMRVLQRIDPRVQDILAAAAHAVIYQFDVDAQEWSRKNVQGSLFVVKRDTPPQFQFTVLNRLSTENLIESLFGDFEYEVHGPYLFYRNHSKEINGIWFYNENECEETAKLFGRILVETSKVPTEPNTSSIKSEVEKDASLEPPSTATTNAVDVVDDQSSAKISSPCQSSTAPHKSITLSDLLTAAAPVSSSSSPSTLKLPIPEYNEPKVADLVRPSSFLSPRPSSPHIMSLITSFVPPASPLISPGNLKRPYGALLFPPFPPTSPQSLTPTSLPTLMHGTLISREKVRKALQLLVQDNQFVDTVYIAMMNAAEE